MGHLTREALARLVSEDPTPGEGEHLESCTLCQAELMAFHEQTEAMGALPDLRPPAEDWEALEARLASEGLIQTSGLALRTSRIRTSGWFQAAAALVLFLGGAALGSRATAGAVGSGVAAGTPTLGMESPSLENLVQSAADIDEALSIMHTAERWYSDALLQYKQLAEAQGDPDLVGNPAGRLVGVQALVAAGQAAVRQAPADPFFNGVLASALIERESILRNPSPTPGVEIF